MVVLSFCLVVAVEGTTASPGVEAVDQGENVPVGIVSVSKSALCLSGVRRLRGARLCLRDRLGPRGGAQVASARKGACSKADVEARAGGAAAGVVAAAAVGWEVLINLADAVECLWGGGGQQAELLFD